MALAGAPPFPMAGEARPNTLRNAKLTHEPAEILKLNLKICVACQDSEIKALAVLGQLLNESSDQNELVAAIIGRDRRFVRRTAETSDGRDLGEKFR